MILGFLTSTAFTTFIYLKEANNTDTAMTFLKKLHH